MRRNVKTDRSNFIPFHYFPYIECEKWKNYGINDMDQILIGPWVLNSSSIISNLHSISCSRSPMAQGEPFRSNENEIEVTNWKHAMDQNDSLPIINGLSRISGPSRGIFHFCVICMGDGRKIILSRSRWRRDGHKKFLSI